MYSAIRLPSILLVLALSAVYAQVAILQIQVVEGEGAVLTPGARSTRPLTVAITDETGRPVVNAAVSFHVPDDGPGATFPNGLRTSVTTTDARGRASVVGLTANRNPGRFQLRIVASKEQARAGIVSFQYVAEPNGFVPPIRAAARSDPDPDAATAAVVQTKPSPVMRKKAKWVTILVLAGGGVAAGALAARSGSSPTAPPAAVQAPTLSIGTPSISVGKP